MAAVNWDGTEKVMNTRAVTLSFYLMMSYKILCRSRTASSTVKKKNRMLTFSRVSTFFLNTCSNTDIYQKQVISR